MAAEQQKLFSIFTSQKHKGEHKDDKHEAKKKHEKNNTNNI